MKKLISIATALAISSALLVGCSSTDEIDDMTNDNFDMLDDKYDAKFNDEEMLYKDGVYKSEFNEYNDGYKDYVEITVQDGSIMSVVHDGINENGMLKTADEDIKSRYLEEYETYPGEFMPIYSNHLLDNKSLDELESHKGTDLEKSNFEILVKDVLENAKNGKTEISSVDFAK